MPQKDSKPWYEEVWFIIVIVILALLLLFVIFALCLRRTGPREPYIRERMPLPPEHQKVPRDLYIIDASDGSVIDAVSGWVCPGGGYVKCVLGNLGWLG